MGKEKDLKYYTLKEDQEGVVMNAYLSIPQDSLIDSIMHNLELARKGKISPEKATKLAVDGFDKMIKEAKTHSAISMEKYRNAMARGQEQLNVFLDNQLFNLFFMANFQTYIDHNFSKDSKEYVMLHRYIKNRMNYPLDEDELQAGKMGHINVKSYYKSLLYKIFKNEESLKI